MTQISSLGPSTRNIQPEVKQKLGEVFEPETINMKKELISRETMLKKQQQVLQSKQSENLELLSEKKNLTQQKTQLDQAVDSQNTEINSLNSRCETIKHENDMYKDQMNILSGVTNAGIMLRFVLAVVIAMNPFYDDYIPHRIKSNKIFLLVLKVLLAMILFGLFSVFKKKTGIGNNEE